MVQEAGGLGVPFVLSFLLPRSHALFLLRALQSHLCCLNIITASKQGGKLQFTLRVISGVLLCGKGSCPAASPQRNRKEMKTTKKSSFWNKRSMRLWYFGGKLSKDCRRASPRAWATLDKHAFCSSLQPLCWGHLLTSVHSLVGMEDLRPLPERNEDSPAFFSAKYFPP